MSRLVGQQAPFRVIGRVLLALLPVTILAFAAACAEPRPPARQPAKVMGMTGAPWLERETRIAEEDPDRLIALLGLEDGDVVADIGCGTGFYARRMARRVAPRGRVYAVDIQAPMLDRLRELAAEEGLTNIVPILGTDVDPKLPEKGIDLVLMVDVYHELQKPREMLANLRRSLSSRGRIVLVEYRLLGESAKDILVDHRMSVEQVLAEWTPEGFDLVRRDESLPMQHVFVFRRR